MTFRLLITQAQLEDRISATTLQRCCDDDNGGTANVDVVKGLLEDGSSKVLSYIGPVYDVDLIDPVQQAEVVRLTKDVCQAYAAQRFPEVMRSIDGFKLMTQAEKDLKLLREGLTNLGIKTPPEPAANQGVRISSGDPQNPSKFTPRFSDNWGGRGGF
jgi:hypothetical protein